MLTITIRDPQWSLNVVHYVTESLNLYLKISILLCILVTLYKKIRNSQEIKIQWIFESWVNPQRFGILYTISSCSTPLEFYTVAYYMYTHTCKSVVAQAHINGTELSMSVTLTDVHAQEYETFSQNVCDLWLSAFFLTCASYRYSWIDQCQ